MSKRGTVYRYLIPMRAANTCDYGGTVDITMPKGASVFHVGRDSAGNASAWALVDPNAEEEPHTLLIVGTGWDTPLDMLDKYCHVGTIVNPGYVWHFFCETK